MLIGQTDIDQWAIASTAWKANRIACNQMIDQCPVDLHDNSKFLTQIGVLQSCTQDTLGFLRTCERELSFLFFVFMGETNEALERFLRHADLYGLPVHGDNDFVIVAGTLKQWVVSCLEGTNQPAADVVEWFCRVRVLLSEKAGVQHVLSRFYDEPVEIDNRQLFRLRIQ